MIHLRTLHLRTILNNLAIKKITRLNYSVVNYLKNSIKKNRGGITSGF